jgi:hypothetical protein
MSALKIPVELQCEYRGKSTGGDFVDKETGEKIEYAAGLKFEIEDPDDGPVPLQLRENKLAEVADFEVGKLKKGQNVLLSATAILAERGSGRASYLRPLKAVLA